MSSIGAYWKMQSMYLRQVHHILVIYLFTGYIYVRCVLRGTEEI